MRLRRCHGIVGTGGPLTVRHHRAAGVGPTRPREWQLVRRIERVWHEEEQGWGERHSVLDPTHHLDGRPVDRLIPEITALKRAGDLGGAAALLERICERLLHAGRDLPPWYFEQLAIVYRKQQRHADEVQLLERYLGADPQPTSRGSRFPQRLAKARALQSRA